MKLMKSCSKCKVEKELELFRKSKNDLYRASCKECDAKLRKKNKDLYLSRYINLQLKNEIFRKECSKCKVEKELELFYKSTSSRDGHRADCIDCQKKWKVENKHKEKEYYLLNKDKIKEKNIVYRTNNKDELKIKSSIYYKNNKERIKEMSNDYYRNNKDSKLEYQKEYNKNNKEKRNLYLIERRQNDTLFKLITNIRNLIYNSFYYNGYSKKSRTQELLGCSFKELKEYLESKFEDWMTWENRGMYNGDLNYGWDIDHIIPLSSVNSEDEIIRLNHYTNLQPLCSKVNRDIKKNNLEYEFI